MFNDNGFVPSLFANTEDTDPGNTDFALVPEGTEILIPLFSSVIFLNTGCGCLPKR
jgi:hypothetical protein